MLVYSGHTILSCEGPQQGDPLGTLLFCGAIHPLLLSLASKLNLAYMDDATLGGPDPQVAQDVETIRRRGEEIGLYSTTRNANSSVEQQYQLIRHFGTSFTCARRKPNLSVRR